MRLGVLGGTFDPVHCGHVEIAEAARDTLRLDEVWLVPANVPPHRPPPQASSYHRFAMAALAVNGRAALRVSTIELEADGPSFTALTLDRLHASGLHPWQIFFITGTDAFAEIDTWYGYPDVLDACHFVVVTRPGHTGEPLRARLPGLAWRIIDAGPAGQPLPPAARAALEGRSPRVFLLEATPPDISSTDVRRLLEAGEPLEGVVPDPVVRHIRQHQLYESVTWKAGPLHVQK